jgi:hypothetical protein
MDATATHTTPAAPPNRVIAAFLAQKTRLLSALGDEGGLFELRFLQRLFARLQSLLTLAAARARTIDKEAASIRQHFLACLNDDKTPGYIDPAESRALQRDLAAHGTHAHTHAAALEKLV